MWGVRAGCARVWFGWDGGGLVLVVLDDLTPRTGENRRAPCRARCPSARSISTPRLPRHVRVPCAALVGVLHPHSLLTR